MQDILQNKVIRTFSRIVVGLTFAFSGFVKLVDPFGTTYKFVDYFTAFGLNALDPLALPLAILMSTLEFGLGLGLLLNLRSKLNTWGVTLFMVVFTPLTLYLAIENPVSDCGCFGDAIILTNWETFYKNLVLDLFILVLLLNLKRFKPVFSIPTDSVGMGVILVLAAGFGYYNSTHLPLMDFRPYEIGADIEKGMEMPEGKEGDTYGYDYTLQNKETGEEKTVDSESYLAQEMWKDTSWVISETSDPYLVKEGYTPPIHDLSMTARAPQSETGYPEGQDILDVALADTSYSFWLVAYDLERTNMKGMQHFAMLARYAKQNGYAFYGLTASGPDKMREVKKEVQAVFHFYNSDPITLKTIVRSNPGLVLLKDGVILDKWHYNEEPVPKEIEAAHPGMK